MAAAQGWNTSLAGLADPLAHRSPSDAQGRSHVLLLPTLLHQLPSAEPAGFLPIGGRFTSRTIHEVDYLTSLTLSLDNRSRIGNCLVTPRPAVHHTRMIWLAPWSLCHRCSLKEPYGVSLKWLATSHDQANLIPLSTQKPSTTLRGASRFQPVAGGKFKTVRADNPEHQSLHRAIIPPEFTYSMESDRQTARMTLSDKNAEGPCMPRLPRHDCHVMDEFGCAVPEPGTTSQSASIYSRGSVIAGPSNRRGEPS